MISFYKKNINFLMLLFLFSFLIRIFTLYIFFQFNETVPICDSKVYDEVGRNIACNKGIMHDDKPLFLRVPLYPIFLGFCYKIFNFSRNKTLIFQAFLSSFIPILIFFLSLCLFPTNLLVAKASAIISAIHVGFITFSNILMAESLFTIFFILFLIFFLSGIKTSNSYLILYCGLLLGAASLTRPVGQFLLILCFFIIMIFVRPLTTATKYCITIFISWFLVVLPWLVRNFLLTTHIFFHTLPGIHFLKHSAARIAMEKNHISYSKGLEEVDVKFKEALNEFQVINNQQASEIESCIIAEKISFQYFIECPILTLKHAILNILKTAFGLYSAELLFIDSKGCLPSYESSRSVMDIFLRFIKPKLNNQSLLLIIYLEILFMIFLVLGNIGFLIKAILNNRLFMIAIVPYSLIFTMFSLSFACGFARLRLPIEPFLIVLSVYFWTSYLQK